MTTPTVGGKGAGTSEFYAFIATFIVVVVDGTSLVNIDPATLALMISIGTGGFIASRTFVKNATAKALKKEV